MQEDIQHTLLLSFQMQQHVVHLSVESMSRHDLRIDDSARVLGNESWSSSLCVF